jgi:hypothetical protein
MLSNLIGSLASVQSMALASLGQFLAAKRDDLEDRSSSKSRNIDFG